MNDDDDFSSLLEASLDSFQSLRGLLRQVRDALGPIEDHALSLPWADERPWTVVERVRNEDGRIAVDLHRLTRDLARDAIYEVLDQLPAGFQLRLIHGRGRHCVGRCPLREMVRDLIDQLTPTFTTVDHRAEGHLDITLTRSFA